MSKAQQPFAVGIDIGGTNTDLGLVTAEGVCVRRQHLATCDFSEANAYADALANAVRELLAAQKITLSDIAGIGIGAPNGNFYTGSIDYAPNLQFKGRVMLKELMEARLATTVTLTNDANAAAWGEKVYGGAKGMNDFILITLGTGVGSGIVVNGQMVYGHDGFAGELGHATLRPNGRRCSCGRRGCLEEYASARGIVQTYRELRRRHGLETPADITCKDLTALADSGDALAQRTWEQTAKHLALALSNAVTFSSPEAIFLMGGPVRAGHWLLDPLRIHFEKCLLSIFQGKTQILRSQLADNDAAILGAAALATH